MIVVMFNTLPIKLPELSDCPHDDWRSDAIGRAHYAEALSCMIDSHQHHFSETPVFAGCGVRAVERRK